MNQETKKKSAALAVLVVVVAAGIYFTTYKDELFPDMSYVAPQEVQYVPPPVTQVNGTNDLGATLYQKSANPLSDKLPGTVAPVANPLQGVYKNPFQ